MRQIYPCALGMASPLIKKCRSSNALNINEVNNIGLSDRIRSANGFGGLNRLTLNQRVYGSIPYAPTTFPFQA